MPFDPETGEPIEVDNDENGEPGNGDNHNLKLLRQQAKEGREALARVAVLERENTIREAGIDTSTPAGRLFLKAYDGDPADVEAMKAAAKEFEVPFVPDPAATTTSEGEGGEGEGATGEAGEQGSSGTDERTALAAGAAADTGVSPHPADVALAEANQAIDDGMSEDDAMGVFVRRQAAAALAGDSRATWSPDAQG